MIHLRTLHLGPDELLVAAKVAVPPGGSAQQVAEAIDDAEARVRSVITLRAMIFLEPDIDREPAGAATEPAARYGADPSDRP